MLDCSDTRLSSSEPTRSNYKGLQSRLSGSTASLHQMSEPINPRSSIRLVSWLVDIEYHTMVFSQDNMRKLKALAEEIPEEARKKPELRKVIQAMEDLKEGICDQCLHEKSSDAIQRLCQVSPYPFTIMRPSANL